MLEDEFADILKKAQRGTGLDTQTLARQSGLTASLISDWGAGKSVPDDTQARALASALGMNPSKFADAAAERWHPEPIERSGVRHHPQNPHPSNGYVFFFEGSLRAALVDPAGVPGNLLDILHDGKYHLEYILITHKHADHCDATPQIAQAFPDAKIVMHESDIAAIGNLGGNALRVKDGEDLSFGDDVRIRMLHTPGHTDGSSSFLFRSAVFTGDTLFAGSVGGAYGDASTYEDILNSVTSKLFTLPDETVVMPGHGPPSKIGWEKTHNPFFSIP
ncbi:MAG: MBL fold metallo-hydrolase [Candidatus Eremiobacteraeota bacterium]|nr:MBL fold metallo-hydrolase [Candidatus Eremiobacteraeota bacterium]